MYKNPWLERKKPIEIPIPVIPDIIITANIPDKIELNLPPIQFVCIDYPVTITEGVQTDLPPIQVDWGKPPKIDCTVTVNCTAWDFQTALGDLRRIL